MENPPIVISEFFTRMLFSRIVIFRGGEISKMYNCPRTTVCKKALVRHKILLART